MSHETPLLNRTRVKRYALELAANRAHKFTRVSAEFLLGCEAVLKEHIRRHVHSHPSVGRTLR